MQPQANDALGNQFAKAMVLCIAAYGGTSIAQVRES
jgi:hypothetical protein